MKRKTSNRISKPRRADGRTAVRLDAVVRTHLKNIAVHADVLMEIPSGEQYLRNIQAVTSIALLEIKACLEAIASRPNVKGQL